jgi:hypothetical protein
VRIAQLLAHRRSEPAPMTLWIVIRVAMQEGDIATILGTPTQQQMINNKIDIPHHFQ